MVGMTYEKIVSSSPSFFEDYFRDLTLKTCPFTDFVLIGGDGSVHQFMNGIYSNKY